MSKAAIRFWGSLGVRLDSPSMLAPIQKRTKPATRAPDAVELGPVPPLPGGPLAFSKNTPWEEFERWRVDLGPRAVFVPEGPLITGGTRAWRCTEVP
jgi:hypothetical protein